MATNLGNPNFVPRQAPEQALLAPVAPRQDLVQGALDAGQIFSKYYQDSLDRALAEKKIQGQEYTNQYTQANAQRAQADVSTDKLKTPAEIQKLQAEAAKAMQETVLAKEKADALNNLINESKNSTISTPAPAITTPVTTQATPPVPVENPVTAAPISGPTNAVQPTNDFAAAHKAVETAIPPAKTETEVAQELTKWKKARALGVIDESSYKRKEHELMVEPQITKFAEEYNDFVTKNNREPNTQEEIINLATKASPDGKIYDEEFLKKRLSALPSNKDLTSQSLQERKFTQDNREALSKELKDYRGVIPVYKKLINRLGNEDTQQKVGNSLGYYKAITRSLGSSDLANGGSAGAILSALNFATEKTGLGSLRSSPDPRDREQLDILNYIQAHPEERKKILPPEIADVYANLGQLINQSLKKQSGSAVSASEFERFAQQYGLNIYGDPQDFFNSLSEIGKNLKTEIDYVRESANPELLKKYDAKGLLDVPEYTPFKLEYESPKKQSFGSSPNSAKEGDTKVVKDNKGNPHTAKFTNGKWVEVK